MSVTHTTVQQGLALWELLVTVFVALFIVFMLGISLNINDESENLVFKSVLDRVEYCINSGLLNKGLDQCFVESDYYINVEYDGKIYTLNKLKDGSRLMSAAIFVDDNGEFKVVKVEYASGTKKNV